MNRLRALPRSVLIGAGICAALAAVGLAAARTEDALSLVPADAASVAVVHFNEFRSSPLAARLFADADHVTVDGDAARFLAEARLSPEEDVDTAVIAATPRLGAGEASVLALFEGRFDPDRLAQAAEARGAVRKTTPAGPYYLLAEKKDSPKADCERPGAVAFVSRHLVIAGTESAVTAALVSAASGGTSFLTGAGLGRELHRIDRGSSAWALIDLARHPFGRKGGAGESAHAQTGEGPATALLGAMKSVSLFAFEATARGEALELSATGLSNDEETRQLLEDSIRGVLAMWRLGVQEKSPELVPVLRSFKVRRDGEGVTVAGTLSGDLLRTLTEAARTKGERR
ncbi:MAG TPA: hypothetical protein VLO07_04950 [Thermoanaerobaculia bacterium]|nr:hypothetical protein [Thermoanaerobaculia bacterium]